MRPSTARSHPCPTSPQRPRRPRSDGRSTTEVATVNTTRTEHPIDHAARLGGKRGLCSARSLRGTVAAAAVCAGLLLAAPAAHAIDGCKVLLCLAGNWRSIGACVGEVRQALRDLARGKAWPTCDFAGATVVVDRPPLPPFERIVT